MQPRDKISKSSWTLLESVKDATTANITNAIRSGQLKIEAAQVEKLLALLAASADEGFHRAHKTFLRGADEALKEAALGESMPSLSKGSSAKKK